MLQLLRLGLPSRVGVEVCTSSNLVVRRAARVFNNVSNDTDRSSADELDGKGQMYSKQNNG